MVKCDHKYKYSINRFDGNLTWECEKCGLWDSISPDEILKNDIVVKALNQVIDNRNLKGL